MKACRVFFFFQKCGAVLSEGGAGEGHGEGRWRGGLSVREVVVAWGVGCGEDRWVGR